MSENLLILLDLTNHLLLVAFAEELGSLYDDMLVVENNVISMPKIIAAVHCRLTAYQYCVFRPN